MKNDNKNIFILYKNEGKFYSAYGIDAYILNYFFNYKIINDNKVGFPDNTIDKVINKLEENKISYQIIYHDKDPIIKDYKKLNKYSNYVSKVKETLELNKQIDMIIDKIKFLDKKGLKEVIKILDSCIK